VVPKKTRPISIFEYNSVKNKSISVVFGTWIDHEKTKNSFTPEGYKLVYLACEIQPLYHMTIQEVIF